MVPAGSVSGKGMLLVPNMVAFHCTQGGRSGWGLHSCRGPIF